MVRRGARSAMTATGHQRWKHRRRGMGFEQRRRARGRATSATASRMRLPMRPPRTRIVRAAPSARTASMMQGQAASLQGGCRDAGESSRRGATLVHRRTEGWRSHRARRTSPIVHGRACVRTRTLLARRRPTCADARGRPIWLPAAPHLSTKSPAANPSRTSSTANSAAEAGRPRYVQSARQNRNHEGVERAAATATRRRALPDERPSQRRRGQISLQRLTARLLRHTRARCGRTRSDRGRSQLQAGRHLVQAQGVTCERMRRTTVTLYDITADDGDADQGVELSASQASPARAAASARSCSRRSVGWYHDVRASTGSTAGHLRVGPRGGVWYGTAGVARASSSSSAAARAGTSIARDQIRWAAHLDGDIGRTREMENAALPPAPLLRSATPSKCPHERPTLCEAVHSL